MNDGYWGSPQWEDNAQSAERTYRSTVSTSNAGDVAIVNASADTMTRYTIVATLVPEGMALGGRAVVSVLHPWGTVYLCDMAGLDMGYVVSKWGPRDRSQQDVHGGDAYCVTRAISQAMEALRAD